MHKNDLLGFVMLDYHAMMEGNILLSCIPVYVLSYFDWIVLC